MEQQAKIDKTTKAIISNDLTVIQRSDEMPKKGKVSDDSLAKLELENAFKDGLRGESYRTHIHRIVVAGIYVVGAILISLCLVWVYHLIMPDQIKWLTKQEEQSVERILFSSVILSMFGKYFGKYNILKKE